MSKNNIQAQSKVFVALLLGCITLLGTFALPVSAEETAQKSNSSQLTSRTTDGRKFEELKSED